MHDDRLWQAVLGEIELSVSRGNYVTWFKNTRLLRHKDGVLTIGVPNVFVKQQLERKYADLFMDILAKRRVWGRRGAWIFAGAPNVGPLPGVGRLCPHRVGA